MSLMCFTYLCFFCLVSLAAVNAVSAVWGARVMGIFTISKFIALSVVIIAGMVKLAQGEL